MSRTINLAADGFSADKTAAALEQIDADLAALPGQYEPVDPYARFRAKLRTDAANAKMVLVGDSTSLEANYPGYYTGLRECRLSGFPLEGIASANIIGGGNNGQTASGWNTGADAGYSLAELTADAPDLVVYCFGLNDTRVGTVTAAQMIDRIETSIELIQAALPAADIMLRMPNSILTTGPYLLGGATGQSVTDICYESYMHFEGRYAYVGVLDTQSRIFGRVSGAANRALGDQLHPNAIGQSLTALAIADDVGIGQRWALGPVAGYKPTEHRELIRLSSTGNGYIDFGATAVAEARLGTEVSIQAGDVLHVEGFGTVDTTGASIVNTSGNNIRILKAGDWTAVNGKLATLVTERPPGIQRGRYWRTVNPPSIAAGSFGTVTVTIDGIHVENGIVARPPLAFSALDLTWNAYVSAASTVTIKIYNPTGAAIDPAEGVWNFWAAY